MSVIAETTFKDMPALQLSDDYLRLTIIPEWGGKVSELFDLRRQREWLFENPVLPYRLPEYGGNYVRDFDVGGFDECFPTVGPCPYPTAPWEGTPLPDHGEVWSIPWAVQVDGGTLYLSTHGVRLPYRLEKTMRLLGNGSIRFTYHATNLSPFPMPFLWSSHPLFTLRPGMRLALPTTRMRIFSAPSLPAQSGDVIPWPRFEDLDLSRVPHPSAGIAAKLFSPPLTEGWAALFDPADGTTFHFEFDPAVVTHLGLWLNYGGWAGAPGAAPYFNLGLEPCIGAPDTLDVAVNHGQEDGLLPPSTSLEWWLDMTVE
jgi:galactose mutarotase-like enzyme